MTGFARYSQAMKTHDEIKTRAAAMPPTTERSDHYPKAERSDRADIQSPYSHGTRQLPQRRILALPLRMRQDRERKSLSSDFGEDKVMRVSEPPEKPKRVRCVRRSLLCPALVEKSDLRRRVPQGAKSVDISARQAPGVNQGGYIGGKERQTPAHV